MTKGVIGDLFIQCLHKKCTLGSWSNQAHLSLQYVDHLWNLIDSQFSNNFTYASYPRIIFRSPNRTDICFRTFRHRAKFIYSEWLFVPPHSFLTIEYRTRTIQFDSDGRK